MKAYFVGGASKEEETLEKLKLQLKEIQDRKVAKFRREQAIIEAERVRKQIEAEGEKPCA